MTSGMERKLNAGKAGKSGKGSGRGRPRKGEGSERKQEGQGREGGEREGEGEGENESKETRESSARVTRRTSSAEAAVTTHTSPPHRKANPDKKHPTSTQTPDVSQRSDSSRNLDKTSNIPHTKDKGRREKANKVKEKKVKPPANTPTKEHKTNEEKSNSPSRSPVRGPPDKSDAEKDTSESESLTTSDKDGGLTPSPTRLRQQHKEPSSKEDKQASGSSSTKPAALPATPEPLALAKVSNLKDPKPPKESEKDPKDLPDATQYPRDTILSRWIESRSGKFGSSLQSPSSSQPRPLMTHKLKPSPFQNLMAAQELLKNQKDSERADKIKTETSSDSSDSSSAQQKTNKAKSECEGVTSRAVVTTSDDEGPQDLSKPRGAPASHTSDDGSEISDDASKTVGSNDCFADDDDDDDDDDTSNEMRIVEDESELRELDLSMPGKHKPEAVNKVSEQNLKNEIKDLDFSVFKSHKAKDSRGSKASSSLDDQNAAACLLQLKSSSTPQSPYVVKILSPEPAHQSSSSSLSGQPMRAPFASRAPPLEAAQPVIPSLGMGESRLVTFSPKGVISGRGIRPLVPPGPEQGRFPHTFPLG